MATSIKRRGFLGGLFVLFLGSITLWSVSITQSPPIDLTFTREVHSTIKPLTLSHSIHHLNNWPQWFYSLQAVRTVDPQGVDLTMEQQTPWVGALLRLNIEPPKKPWKKFQLFMEVAEYIPGKLLTLRLHSDSTGRLTQLFESLIWRIELLQEGQGILIRGSAHARAIHWRSKFFGTIASKILLNQVFYPDLVKLSELENPKQVTVPQTSP